MTNIKSLFVLLTVLICLMLFLIFACGKMGPFFPGANTDLKSSTFTSLAAARAQGITITGTSEGGYWKLTPTKIIGNVGSVFFPIDNTSNEGVVVYGNSRPDLMTSSSSLYPFDLSTTTRLSGNINKAPWYVGGKASIILMAYGYFDVYFNHAGAEKVIRFAYGSIPPYTKGDILYKDGIDFKWLDRANDTFVSTRPSSPEVIDFIARDAGNSEHPETAYFFPLAARVTNSDTGTTGIDLPVALIDNNDLIFTVDFTYNNAILFDLTTGITSEADFNSRSLVDLIKGVDLTQNRIRWDKLLTETDATKMINCTIKLTATPIKGGT